jgi:hypothetical protein
MAVGTIYYDEVLGNVCTVYISHDGGKTVASTYPVQIFGAVTVGTVVHILQAYDGLFVLHI